MNRHNRRNINRRNINRRNINRRNIQSGFAPLTHILLGKTMFLIFDLKAAMIEMTHIMKTLIQN